MQVTAGGISVKREILNEAVKLNIAHRRRKRWYRVVSGMAAIVVFVTTYALILPAITMEKETVCGLEEHAHTEACYYAPVLNTGQAIQCAFSLHTHEAACIAPDGTLICGYADFAVHTHDPRYCYDENNVLVCALEEHREHIHTDNCYEEHLTYTCGQNEGEGSHVHGEACYTPAELICSLIETEGHTHGEGCYGQAPLVCQMEESEEHVHCMECYGTAELVCQVEETAGHVHDETCYGEKQLICTLEEQSGHVHNETCGEEISRDLVCDQEEIVLHTHEAGCFDEMGVLICGLQQVQAHQHDESCFAEHVHTEFCYQTSDTETVLICPYHVHDESCYDEQGQQVCALPVLICGMEEHTHEESCYPEVDDDMVDVTFEVPETYLGYIRSDVAFPLIYSLVEGTTLAESGCVPVLSVVNPDIEAPEYLAEYHWVTADGFPVDESALLAEDTTLTLRLYPADDPEAAQLVTATFL